MATAGAPGAGTRVSSAFFSYSEENLDAWAQKTLASIFAGEDAKAAPSPNQAAASGDASPAPTPAPAPAARALSFDTPKVTGSCWRACKSATKVIHFFELAVAAPWRFAPVPSSGGTNGGDDGDVFARPVVRGAVHVPSVCLDDAEDGDFHMRVASEEHSSADEEEDLSSSATPSSSAAATPTPVDIAVAKAAVKAAVLENMRTFAALLRSYAPAAAAPSPAAALLPATGRGEPVPAAAVATREAEGADDGGGASSDDDDAPTLSGMTTAPSRRKLPAARSITVAAAATTTPPPTANGPKTAVQLAAESIAAAKDEASRSQSSSGQRCSSSPATGTAGTAERERRAMFVRVRVDQEDMDDDANARKNAPGQLKNEYELEVCLDDTVSHVLAQVRASLIQQSFSDEYSRAVEVILLGFGIEGQSAILGSRKGKRDTYLRSTAPIGSVLKSPHNNTFFVTLNDPKLVLQEFRSAASAPTFSAGPVPANIV